MNKVTLAILSSAILIAGANAALITNGDWESTVNPNWVSHWGHDSMEHLNGWHSSLKEAVLDGAYVEVIDAYGDGLVGAMKAVEENYFQQTLNGVDAGIGQITVNYDVGFRVHRSYVTDPRNITLRVSLWDASNEVELVGANDVMAYASTGLSLQPRSHVLSYDATGLAGNDLALRFQSLTFEEGDAPGNVGHSTILFDNIVVIPEPATFGLLAVFGGGILFLRRNKLML